MRILFVIYIQRDQFASETPRAAKTVHAVSSKTFLLLLWYALTLTALLLQSQENFLVFSKQTFCSFKLQVGNQIGKDLSHGQAMFIPTYNKRTNALVKNLRHCSNMSRKRMRSCLSGRRINITLIFMSSSSYLVHAISCRRILLKYRFL